MRHSVKTREHADRWYAIMESDLEDHNALANVASDRKALVEESFLSSRNSSMVWSIIVHSGSLYVQSDSGIQFSLGPILGIQASKDKAECIKVSGCNKIIHACI